MSNDFWYKYESYDIRKCAYVAHFSSQWSMCDILSHWKLKQTQTMKLLLNFVSHSERRNDSKKQK